MAKSLTTPILKSIVMKLGSNMNSPQIHTTTKWDCRRKNRTLITLARTMLDEYNTSEKMWAEAINTVCYASNRLFPHKFPEKTPYDLLNGKKPNVSFFRVFGCKCYIYKKRQHLDQRRCDIGSLVGYSSKSKAYRVINHVTNMFEETFDVEFEIMAPKEQVIIFMM